MFTITKKGVVFKYHGDHLLKYWFWVKRGYFNSRLLSQDFSSLREYWEAVGKDTALVRASRTAGNMIGFSYLEMAKQWSVRMFKNEYILVLMDVHPSMKGPAFWSRLTSKQKNTLLEDVVFLPCKDKTELTNLFMSIDPGFADAYGVLNGSVILDSNRSYKDYSEDEE